ncbi:unnamed protein product [Auanema sp. JU1783]|nr:unnamed protein product [Auanema sp. JU1783]
MEGERLSTKTAHILRTAAVTPDHFKNLGNQHSYEFGAVAEFLDNSVDAGATEMHIDVEFINLNPVITFLDNGNGMSREECVNIAVLGESKKAASNKIGRFGTGLKSGAMKLGEDFVIFTKKKDCVSCVYMGTSASKVTGIQQVAVAVPSFEESSFHPIEEGMQRHKLEMKTILEYSPFRTLDVFFQQFQRIPGESGTLVVMYNFHLNPSGNINLDFDSDPNDICVKDSSLNREMESLREFLATLYYNPTMKIYLRNSRVLTKRMASCLYFPRKYKIETKLFKESAALALQKIEFSLDRIRQESNRVKGEMSSLCLGDRSMAPNERLRNNAERLRKETRLEQLNEIIYSSEQEVNRLKAMKKFDINPIFGINIHDRSKYGLILHSNGRMVKMYEKLPSQEKMLARNQDEWKYMGVVCYLNIPYHTVPPAINKETLATVKEYKGILRILNERLLYYWAEFMMEINKCGMQSALEFWKKIGYSATDCLTLQEPRRREAYLRTGFDVQCERCGKWRSLAFTEELFNSNIPSNWRCEDNPNPHYRSCHRPEALVKIKDGKEDLVIDDENSIQNVSKQRVEKKRYSQIKTEQPPDHSSITVVEERPYRQHQTQNRAFIRMSLVNDDIDDDADFEVTAPSPSLRDRSLLKRPLSTTTFEEPDRKLQNESNRIRKTITPTGQRVGVVQKTTTPLSTPLKKPQIVSLHPTSAPPITSSISSFRIPKIKTEASTSNESVASSGSYIQSVSSNDMVMRNIERSCTVSLDMICFLDAFAKRGSETAKNIVEGATVPSDYLELGQKVLSELEALITFEARTE